MALTVVKNYGDFVGTYLSEPNVSAVTNSVETTIVSGISATKSADKTIWISGPLEYTVELKNDSGESFENVVFTDTLNTSVIVLDESYGVYVNGTQIQNYTYSEGLLTVPVSDIEEAGSVKIIFRVLQA